MVLKRRCFCAKYMKVIHLSYAHMTGYNDPITWLQKLGFYVGILKAMTKHATVESVHCIAYEGTVTQNLVTYHFLNLRKWQLWFPLRLHKYIKKLRPSAVIVHGLIFPWQVLWLRWQLGKEVKIIAQHHAEKPFKDFRKYFQRWADRDVDAYLFCSDEQGAEWLAAKQIKLSNKIKAIMGTSSPFHVIERGLARAVTGADDAITFLWVGRLDHNKDPLTVARAFIRFAKANPRVKLYMIYQTSELVDELRAVIAEAAAFNIIQLVGKVNYNDLIYWYNSADFIISGSHYEGSGIAICEGLSCGCIPVLTNIPSFRMMTDNGRVGFLYNPGDGNALFNELRKSLTVDCEELKRQVLEHFDRNLSFDANAKKIAEVIQSL